MNQLKRILIDSDIPDPQIIVTDKDDGLIRALSYIFPVSDRLLCLWYINNNIISNCKPAFPTKEEWDAFSKAW